MRYCGLIEDREQKKFTESKMYFFGIWMLVFGISAAGCVSEPTRTYGKEVVTTYAQLTLLYEKEKMVNKVSDSLYQVKVKDFFKTKGIEEKVFRKGVEEFSRNEGVWKLFIQDVSAVMDSLKAAGRP
jgi:uncharacterized lipoprotein YehR (DUF1307 family)